MTPNITNNTIIPPPPPSEGTQEQTGEDVAPRNVPNVNAQLGQEQTGTISQPRPMPQPETLGQPTQSEGSTRALSHMGDSRIIPSNTSVRVTEWGENIVPTDSDSLVDSLGGEEMRSILRPDTLQPPSLRPSSFAPQEGSMPASFYNRGSAIGETPTTSNIPMPQTASTAVSDSSTASTFARNNPQLLNQEIPPALERGALQGPRAWIGPRQGQLSDAITTRGNGLTRLGRGGFGPARPVFPNRAVNIINNQGIDNNALRNVARLGANRSNFQSMIPNQSINPRSVQFAEATQNSTEMSTMGEATQASEAVGSMGEVGQVAEVAEGAQAFEGLGEIAALAVL